MYKILNCSFSHFSKYAVVGILTLLIYITLTFSLERFYEVNILASSSGAFSIATVFNYLMHYYWTYNTQRSHKSASVMYLITVGLGFFYNLTIVEVCGVILNVSEYFGVVTFSLSWPIISYLMMRKNVFIHKAEK